MKRAAQDNEPLWRDEFSIETATESYVARRQFAKFLVLTSLGMFAGNLWILVRNWFRTQTIVPASVVRSHGRYRRRGSEIVLLSDCR